MYLIIGITEDTNDLIYQVTELDVCLVEDARDGVIRIISLHEKFPREIHFPGDGNTYDNTYTWQGID